MAQQYNIVEDEMSAVESTSFSPIMIKEIFSKWLSDGHAKKYPPAAYISCIDKVSAYLIRRKISSVDLWELTNFEFFKNVYDKAINDKLFKATDKKTHTVFVQVGQTFLKFLKSKPAINKVTAVQTKSSNRPDSHLTIKESIIHVLENEQQGMTVEQIYNKIIADGLYSFGAQNPLSVVRIEIDRACVNSNYATRAAKNCFRFERDEKGEKVYFLLSPTPTSQTGQPNSDVNGEPIMLGEMKKEPSIIEFWNDSIESSFQNWMKFKNYAPSTARNYCSAVNRVIQNFKPLVDIAVNESPATPEAIQKFVALIHQDSGFIAANSTAHNQLSAALAALARFIDGDTSINTALVVASPEKTNNAAITSKIVTVLSAHFSNGFRLESPIELLRFRRFAAEDFGEEVALTDEELIKSISSCGTFFDNKVYIIGNEIISRIQNKVDLAILGGAEIIFYNSFYARHEEWLFAGNVISEEMLKDILIKLYPKYTHKANYFSPKEGNGTELDKIRREIMRVWGSDVVLNYGQLSERLSYIPLDKIKYVLAQNGDFIWNATEVYTHVDRFDVTDEEYAAIADYVAAACRTDGYTPLSDVPLGEIEERNYELTLTAIHNALFRIVLADKYDRRGKIITRKGDTLDAFTIMKEHCRKLDKCSLQDLLDFERELTGESHRWIPMEAGYSVMVRVDENSYIAEKYVHFDATGIDRILDLFVTGEYLPLKSITTFAAFPHCGQAWNLFLLESYCRRFSDRFRFEVLSVNSKNAGAIVRKSCLLSYIQIMADAVAESDTPLEKAAIEEFLYNKGYIGRRSYAKTDELIEQAKVIREGRD